MSTAYVWESETATCARCGLSRQIHPGRDIADVCVDCRTVERLAAREAADGFAGIFERGPGGIYRRRQPMSDEDMAWCEKAAERHWWTTWERTNRAGTTSEATVQQAIRKVS